MVKHLPPKGCKNKGEVTTFQIWLSHLISLLHACDWTAPFFPSLQFGWQFMCAASSCVWCIMLSMWFKEAPRQHKQSMTTWELSCCNSFWLHLSKELLGCVGNGIYYRIAFCWGIACFLFCVCNFYIALVQVGSVFVQNTSLPIQSTCYVNYNSLDNKMIHTSSMFAFFCVFFSITFGPLSHCLSGWPITASSGMSLGWHWVMQFRGVFPTIYCPKWKWDSDNCWNNAATRDIFHNGQYCDDMISYAKSRG